MARPADMRCQDFVEHVTAYLEGALAPGDRDCFETHHRSCSRCQAHLAEMRLVTSSLRRLRPEPPADLAGDKARLLGLFRSRGPLGHAPREPSLPLGIGDAIVALGDHVAYFWESERELDATADFLAAGLERDEVGVLVGHEAASDRVLTALERRGLDPEELRRGDRLHVGSGRHSGAAILGYLDDRIKAAVDRGVPAIRILGNLGWNQPGWAADRDLLAMEAQTTDILKRLPSLALCAYDVRGLPERILSKGGLECHPWTFRHGRFRRNERHVPAEPFLEALAREST
jgi:hypothetical protein